MTQSKTKNTWMAELSLSLEECDRELLSRAWSTLQGNILTPSESSTNPLPWHPNRGICPSPHRYRGMWNWDSAFHAIGVARWDMVLAHEQIRIFLDTQLPSGGLPDHIKETGTSRDTSEKPPVMAWAVETIDRRCPDDTFLSYAYLRLVKNESFWWKHRGGSTHGLFHYDSLSEEPDLKDKEARWESGWDDSVRWDHGVRCLWAIDLNCYMVLFYRALSYMALRLGISDDLENWNKKEQDLIELLDEKLFDPSTGCYVDYNFEENLFSDAQSPASFMPLYIGIASVERAACMAQLAEDENKFTPGMPTVAYDNPDYDCENYWRGPTWLNVAYFALKGLKNYGYNSIADHSRKTILDWCQSNESIWELYNSRTGEGIRTKDFGWSAAFIIEFLLNWD